MKRQKSKTFKSHKAFIKAAISNIFKKKVDERYKDEEFVRENRFELEFNKRNPR